MMNWNEGIQRAGRRLGILALLVATAPAALIAATPGE
jgi:hypothetical protein